MPYRIYFFAKNRDNITWKKDVIDGEEVTSITLNDADVYDCLINIEYKFNDQWDFIMK